MRWTLILVLAGLVLPASAAAAPTAQVRVATCEQGSATFEGDMRTVRGAVRLQMRFTLQARESRDQPWARLPGPRLDTWVTSNPRKLRYVYDKRVDGLVGPGEYRMNVRFRWVGAGGTTVAHTRRISRVCRQHDPRPDLRLTSVRYQDGAYLVGVRNSGRGLASPFDVSLTLPGSDPILQRAGSLAAGERATVSISAPACDPGTSVQVALDAGDEVDEATESDDIVTVACPSGR